MEDNFKRIKTSLKIKTCIICNKCPLKLYAKDDSYVEYGKGFLLPKYIFVLPSEKDNSKIEEYLHIICKDLINLDEQYITYNPKCYTNNNELKHHTEQCDKYLVYEINKLKPKKVIFFGVDIPKELYDNKYNIELYKFNNLLTIQYGSKTIQDFINSLKKVL